METHDESQKLGNITDAKNVSSHNSGESDGETNQNTSSHQPVEKQSNNSDSQESHDSQDHNHRNVDEERDGSNKVTFSLKKALRGRSRFVGTSGKMSSDATNTDQVDNNSETSEFSEMSEESWHPVQGPIAWVQEQMRQGHSPRKILEDLVPSGTMIPDGLDPIMLWKIIINIVSEPPRRKKLDDVNTLDDVIHLLKTKKRIMVLTGAGVSVSCGIPDFRSRDGVYARLAVDFPNLPDPQAMFDIHFFKNDPRPFFKFAKEIYPGQFHPSPCHHFIRLLESKGKLLRNYTQNIDTLEQVAGIERVVQCHGSFATATCAVCDYNVNSDVIKEDIFKQVIPLCSKCPSDDERAVMKPDIVFFGESLPESFHNQMAADKDDCDLLIVIGSSLKVRPVALIPNSLPPDVPQILINRERLNYLNFDVELLGNCDDIVGDLCKRMGEGWQQLASPGPPLTEVDLSSLPTPPASPQQQDSDSSSPMKEPCETNANMPPPSSDTTDEHSCVDCSGKDTSKRDASTQGSSTEAEPNGSDSGAKCSCSVNSLQSDLSQSSCKTGSINCGITPHHKQDVMFCPTKGAPHSLTQQQIVKCSSETSQGSSSCGQDPHHTHHHTHQHMCHHPIEKRKSTEPCDDDDEPIQKHQKLDNAAEVQPNEPGVSSEADDSKPPESPDMCNSVEEIRKMWQSRQQRISLAHRLSDDQVLFLPPCRYVFKGAEVFSDYDGEDSDESSSSSSSSSSDDSSESEEEKQEEEEEELGKDQEQTESLEEEITKSQPNTTDSKATETSTSVSEAEPKESSL